MEVILKSMEYYDNIESNDMNIMYGLRFRMVFSYEWRHYDRDGIQLMIDNECDYIDNYVIY